MPETERVRRRRWPWVLAGAIALVALTATLALRWFADPARLTALITAKIGSSLGAELATGGSGRYAFMPGLRLSLPQPRLQHGGAMIARADSLTAVVPWSTLWSGPYRIDRIELVRPVLDLDALQSWLASRPPSDAAPADLRFTLHVEAGTLQSAHGVLAEGMNADFRNSGDLAAWLAAFQRAPESAPLLPPATGAFDAARIEIGGTRIDDVHVELDDGAPAPPPSPR
jgi:hypothetical protein